MKASIIAKDNNFDLEDFERYLIINKIGKTTFLGDIVLEENFPEIVEAYKKYLMEQEAKKRTEEENKKEKERIRLEQETAKQQAKQQALSAMLISSGFSFDGYKIVKYSGYISGDDTVQIDRSILCNTLPGSDIRMSKVVCDALVKIRIQALKELKEAAYALGCNAVIGVDFDYMTFEPQTANIGGGKTYYPYVIVVTANGNAVVIEKE